MADKTTAVDLQTMKNEGVAAYFPKAETCRDTSLLSENSRVGGDFPHPNPRVMTSGTLPA